MTFGELKAELDKLMAEQLAQPARWWGDERGGTIDRLLILEEDYVSFGEGMEPWSVYAGDSDYAREDADAIMVKGTPVLCTDEAGEAALSPEREAVPPSSRETR